MAMITAQPSAGRRSLATQSARSINRMTQTVRVVARVPERTARVACVVARSSLRGSFSMDLRMICMFGSVQIEARRGLPQTLDGHQFVSEQQCCACGSTMQRNGYD